MVASPESRENGRQRAKAGVPLTAVMAAYRVAARYLWDCLAETAARSSVPAEVTLRAASEMWLVLDTFTQEMAEGYREEITSQVLSQEQERSALVQALLEGRLADANLWDAAGILQLPPPGPLCGHRGAGTRHRPPRPSAGSGIPPVHRRGLGMAAPVRRRSRDRVAAQPSGSPRPARRSPAIRQHRARRDQPAV